MRTRSLHAAQIAVSKLDIGADRIGLSPRIPPEDTFILALHLTDQPYHELWSHGRPFIAQGYRANSMRIVNLADEHAANISHPHRSLAFYIPRIAIDECAEEAGIGRVDHMRCTPGTIDPVVVHLGAALLPAFETGADQLFLDHVTMALGSHLIHTYSETGIRESQKKWSLTAAQLHCAKDYLAANNGDVSMLDVAKACGLSRGHFARAFKATVGYTPHQWLLRHRIERAKGLIAQEEIPIADIALLCGFSDQSHLTRVFTRLVGTSPAAWRRALRNR
jgi:AraC-like DNA-binding protein